MLLHFYTMGFISTSQHFCASQSLKTMMGPNVFSYTFHETFEMSHWLNFYDIEIL